MKKMYPVIFTQTKDCILVEVPDLNIFSEGKDMENAMEMARDAISLTIVSMEDNGEKVPEATEIFKINVGDSIYANEGKSFLSIVDTDIAEYRRKIDTKPVRRNVSLPSWLNYAADAAGLNVSRVLQEALMETLGIKCRY